MRSTAQTVPQNNAKHAHLESIHAGGYQSAELWIYGWRKQVYNAILISLTQSPQSASPTSLLVRLGVADSPL
jgi:hypothetical protein